MNQRNAWTNLGADLWALALEAGAVVNLRLLVLAAGGPSAQAELQRMVGEKLVAGLTLPVQAAVGGLGLTPHAVAARTVIQLRRKVRANRRRLERR